MPEVIRVIYAEEFTKANPQDIVALCYDFHRKNYPNIRFLLDGLTLSINGYNIR